MWNVRVAACCLLPNLILIPSDMIREKFYHYHLFGLNIRSCLEVPYCEPWNLPATADVTITFGHVPNALAHNAAAGIGFQATPGRFLLNVDHTARFLVLDGEKIIIQKEGNAEDRDVSLFLFGSAMGALLHQRGWLPPSRVRRKSRRFGPYYHRGFGRREIRIDCGPPQKGIFCAVGRYLSHHDWG